MHMSLALLIGLLCKNEIYCLSGKILILQHHQILHSALGCQL